MKPYYERDGIVIYHGDCRDIVPTLSGVDMVVTDPPYGVGYRGGHFHSGDVRIQNKREALAGDDGDVYSWSVPLLFDVCRGPCYLFFSDSRASDVYRSVEAARGQIHALIIWHKTNAKYAAMNSQYKQRHEPLLYCKGPKAKTLWAGPSTESTVWEMKRDAENVYHPTQKPVAVMGRAIGNHDAELILDPFMGAGSTLRAAADLGRRAIGIEVEERYCEIAAERLRQKTLF